MENPNPFRQKMQELENDKLLKVIEHRDDYQPEAVEAAIEEALKRDLINDDLSSKKEVDNEEIPFDEEVIEERFEIDDKRKQKTFELIEKECQRSNFNLQIKDHDVIQIAKKQRWIDQSGFSGTKFDFLQCFHITGDCDNFFLTIPWSGRYSYPFEIFSVCDGNIPHSVSYEKSALSKKWKTTGKTSDEKFLTKLLYKKEIVKGLKWSYHDSAKLDTVSIDWGIQALPLIDNQLLYLFKNPISKLILDHFINSRDEFVKAVKLYNYKGTCKDELRKPTISIIVINKKYPEIFKKMLGGKIDSESETESDSESVETSNMEIITEFEYEKILNEFAELIKGGSENADYAKIGEELKLKVLEENQALVNKLASYQINTKGIENPKKAIKRIQTDLDEALEMKVSGMVEKKDQATGCIGGLILAGVIVIWAAIPSDVHWLVKILLSIIIVAIGSWIISLRRKHAKKKIQSNNK